MAGCASCNEEVEAVCRYLSMNYFNRTTDDEIDISRGCNINDLIDRDRVEI